MTEFPFLGKISSCCSIRKSHISSHTIQSDVKILSRLFKSKVVRSTSSICITHTYTFTYTNEKHQGSISLMSVCSSGSGYAGLVIISCYNISLNINMHYTRDFSVFNPYSIIFWFITQSCLPEWMCCVKHLNNITNSFHLLIPNLSLGVLVMTLSTLSVSCLRSGHWQNCVRTELKG